MDIERLSQEDGARKARGITVIIDVFRAFTCEPFMYHYGAEGIFLESNIETCRTFAGKALLVGERDGQEIEGFDLGNSPSVIVSKGRDFFEGRSVIHRTTSGVTGALAALEHSDEVLLASYVSARATARYILNRKPTLVSIVAMGVVSVQRTLEDEYCGDYIENLLTGKPYDHVKALGDILSDETAQKFLRGDRSYYPREDAVICLQRDLFDFTLGAERRDGLVAAVKKLP